VLLATLAAMTLALASQADTSLTAQRGDRLDLSVHSGDITIRTWNRSTVEVHASDDARAVLNRHGSVISVGTEGRRHGPDDGVDFEITVPTWMDLTLGGVNTDIRITGSDGAITAETVEGDVEVDGGNGVLSLHSVDGSVTLSHAKGKMSLGSVNSDVTVDGASGQLSIETVNGEIRLRAMDSDDVDANSVNGDVSYDGTIRSGGRYHFVTHNGDVTVSVPDGADATVSVSTYQGDFESAFPITTRGSLNKRFSFTLGTGSAKIELESFQGTIRLVRPDGSAGRTRTRR
jgi:DUF4097 and DUF4098 domain-containing protein YvlB